MVKSQEIDSLLEDLLFYTNQRLIEFAQSDEFNSVLAVSFGAEDDTTTVETLQESLLSGGFFNGIEVAVLPSETLQGALGAYAATTNTIYLSQGLLDSSLETATAVLLEEVGHAIDDFLNVTDSAGDEGAIFASLVEGKESGDLGLASLKKEDDSTTLDIDGEAVIVEQATFTVTTADDIGQGSLRQAILDANNTPGADTITFSSSLSGQTITLSSGSLQITDDLTIQGLGAAQLTLEAGEDSSVFFIEDDNSVNTVQASMSGVTITGGSFGGIVNNENLTITDSTITGNSDLQDNNDGAGGGIDNSGVLTLTNSTISGNSANSNGGGILNRNNAELTISNSTFSDNAASHDGGAIFNGDHGTLTITNSSISGNSAGDDGGAIWSGYYGTFTINDTIIRDNSTNDDGGGIANQSTLTIRNSIISGNSASDRGGGISNFSYGDIRITNSTISSNSASDRGGGILNQGTTTLANSTISRNFAFRNGGGIDNLHGTTTLANSTISRNSAADDGGGIYNLGTGTTTLANSTISGNSAADNGGGIYNLSGTTTLANSISANNFGGEDVRRRSGTVNTSGTNIVEDGSLTGDNVINADPNLSPLQDNGGATETNIPREGSPAIDAGNNDNIPSDFLDLDNDGNTDEPIPFDQRGEGFDRIINDVVDLGAVEFGNNGGGGNQAPVAEDDTASTGSNSALSQNVLSNDSDAEGDSLTVSAVNGEESNVGSELTLASGALLTLNADGSFEYDPNNAFDNLAEGETTTDRFSYTVSDGNDGTDTANVAIDITGVPVPSFNLDVDNNGVADPFTDGLTIFRFLGGLNPETYELASDADRSVTAVQEFLFGGETFLDVDNNGVADPFTDGLTIFRFLGGLNPETYELASDADRGVAEIQEFLQPFLDAV
ncbi:UNVERIFIED_CONTAM: hypothetical protein BEN50_12760 [Euhalothece sp. KZN 001]